MLRFRLSPALLGIVLAAIVCTNIQARTNINIQIATPVPPPVREVVGPPVGYNNCYMVPPGWYNNIWIPAHQECQYPSPYGVSVWAAGYWGCTQYWRDGRCGHWRWSPGHWTRRAPDQHPGGSYRHYGPSHEYYHHEDRHWR